MTGQRAPYAPLHRAAQAPRLGILRRMYAWLVAALRDVDTP